MKGDYGYWRPIQNKGNEKAKEKPENGFFGQAALGKEENSKMIEAKAKEANAGALKSEALESEKKN